jgi:plastocyanin
MLRLFPIMVLAAAPFLLVACGDSVPPTGPAFNASAGPDTRLVHMMDACDPETFNAAVGPGSCVRTGGVHFDRFIQLLTDHHSVGAWHFAPATVNASVGQTLLAANHGGEVHTFTEVEEYGGGIVPDLNALAGTPEPAPECLALTGSDFVPPGGTAEDEVEEPGTELYQCCIHPWMRAEVTARP